MRGNSRQRPLPFQRPQGWWSNAISEFSPGKYDFLRAGCRFPHIEPTIYDNFGKPHRSVCQKRNVCILLSRVSERSAVHDRAKRGVSVATGDDKTALTSTFDASAPAASSGEINEHARRLISAANELLALAAELQGSAESTVDPGNELIDNHQLADIARLCYSRRRLRAKVFEDPDLFGEPAWDLLLDLFVAAREGKRVPVTSACIGAAVPTTTALRWIAMLEARGLVVKENDANDARRVFVRLTEDADMRMADYFVRATEGPRGKAFLKPSPTAVNEGATRPFILGK